MLSSIKKIKRYTIIYGPLRTVAKVAGRVRYAIPLWPFLNIRYPIRKGRKIGIIGCGQFAYSTISYFLSTCTNFKLVWCYDKNLSAAKSMADAYGIDRYVDDVSSYINDVDLVYIASNHASHAEYAIQCMKADCDVYVEKPLATSWEQFNELLTVVKETKKQVYVGYNRPYSPAISLLHRHVEGFNMPFSFNCFVTGHFIAEDHWYRDEKEGTRVCGNLGHWLDLAVHILCWSQELPETLTLSISYSDKKTPSDNMCVTLTTSRGDLISLTFSSRSEPFEGVNESISFQQGNVIVKIDDHRHTKLWKDEKYESKRHWPKNVGHKRAILQPANEIPDRDWNELVLSTDLILILTDMVKNLEVNKKCKIENFRIIEKENRSETNIA